MQYVPFGSLSFDVSRLGFGAMRLPVRQVGEEKVVDEQEAVRIIRYAIDQGVNYMDTAYGYHDGKSEVVMGKALKSGYRERVTLTTKLPHWAVSEKADLDKVLDLQLKRLDEPYVDFYILHAMNKAAFEKLETLDFRGFYDRALKDGRIKHTGFSFHDEADVFLNILNSYDFEMAQVQFNYLDEEEQAGLKGIKAAGKKHVPIVVMEPLRGGSLANPPKEVRTLIDKDARGYSPVEWAFRYVADVPEVVTILSGMSNFEQVKDNINIFSKPDIKADALTRDERVFLKRLRGEYLKRMPIGCTHCDYCQPCPKGIKIPNLFEEYNMRMMLDKMAGFPQSYAQHVDKSEDAGQCVACKKCMNMCPQKLDIVTWLKTLHQAGMPQ